MKKRIAGILSNINRFYLYLGLVIVITAPLFLDVKIPVLPGKYSEKFYKEIDSLKKGDKVVISIEYNFDTQVELEPMVVASIKHCLRKGVGLIFVSLWHQGPEMVHSALVRALQSKELMDTEVTYGKDYINLGFAKQGSAVVKGMNNDVLKFWPVDYYGSSVLKYPLMKGIKSFDDIAAVIDFSAGTVDNMNSPVVYAMYAKSSKSDFKILAGSSAVIAAELYPFLQAGKIDGVLNGLKGAADYESLLSHNFLEGSASGYMPSLSLALLFVLILIVIGNVSQFLLRGKK